MAMHVIQTLHSQLMLKHWKLAQAWLTESLRFMVPNSSNRMTLLAGAELKMKEEHLNI